MSTLLWRFYTLPWRFYTPLCRFYRPMETSTGHVWTFSRLLLSCPCVLEITVPSSMMSYLPIFNTYGYKRLKDVYFYFRDALVLTYSANRSWQTTLPLQFLRLSSTALCASRWTEFGLAKTSRQSKVGKTRLFEQGEGGRGCFVGLTWVEPDSNQTEDMA
jgi:hypothetical protein